MSAVTTNVLNNTEKIWPNGHQKTASSAMFQSAQLPTCITQCSSEAASDNRLFKDTPAYPGVDASLVATFAMCNRYYTRCFTTCQEGVDEEIQEWQKDHLE